MVAHSSSLLVFVIHMGARAICVLPCLYLTTGAQVRGLVDSFPHLELDTLNIVVLGNNSFLFTVFPGLELDTENIGNLLVLGMGLLLSSFPLPVPHNRCSGAWPGGLLSAPG